VRRSEKRIGHLSDFAGTHEETPPRGLPSVLGNAPVVAQADPWGYAQIANNLKTLGPFCSAVRPLRLLLGDVAGLRWEHFAFSYSGGRVNRWKNELEVN
jgi:hypothetical protein